MCLEDYRIARKTRQVETLVNVIGVVSQVLVPRNHLRTAIMIGSSQTNGLWFGRTKNVALNKGILMVVNALPLVLDLLHHGDIVRDQWWIFPDTGNDTITVWESVLDLE